MSTIHGYYERRYAAVDPRAPLHIPRSVEECVTPALAALGPNPCRVLDFGCNRGASSRLFVDAGHSVSGVDIARPLIDAASHNVPEGRFHLIEPETSLPFPDTSFDACYASEVIEHLFDVRGFVVEMRRVLAPGGLLLITTPHHGWLKNLLVITFRFERHFNPHGGHIRFFSRRSIADCLNAGGFEVEKITGIGRMRPLWKSMFVVARKR